MLYCAIYSNLALKMNSEWTYRISSSWIDGQYASNSFNFHQVVTVYAAGAR